MEAHTSEGAAPLKTHHATSCRLCHITFRARTHSFRSHNLTNMGGDFTQMNVNKRRSHDHDAAARQDLERPSARAIMVEVVPRPNTKKQSSGAHEPTEDVEAARVDLRNARNTTRANCDPSGQ